MSTNFVIREATVNDLPRLKEIINVSFPWFFRVFAAHSVADTSEPVLVASAEGAVVGFAKLIEFKIGGSKYGCILWIAVDPSSRQRGIASGLTNSGVAYLKKRGAQAVFASTQRRNKAALAALGKTGFQRMGVTDLWRLFGVQILRFYNDIWLAPGEVVLMHP